MAGWLKRVDGSCLESLRTHKKVQKLEVWLDLQTVSEASVKAEEQEQDCRDKLKFLFDDFLSSFLKEISGTSCFRPLPPTIGDGQSVDLFNLYLNVTRRGGCERVSENGLWDSVAKECGFDSNVSSALKLVYFKYLDALQKCLQKAVKDNDSKSGVKDSTADLFCGLLMDLESDLKGFLSEISDKKKKDGEYINVELQKAELQFVCDGKLSDIDENPCFLKLDGEAEDVDGNVVHSVDRGDHEERNAGAEHKAVAANVGDEISIEGGDVVSDSIEVKEDVSTRKRRRESFLGMLNWINRVAKDPCDPAVGYLPESSKWKYYANDKAWKQVLLTREARRLKSKVESSEQLTGQKKQKMHPIMYDDHTASERLRFSQRIVSAKDSFKKSHAWKFVESSFSGTQSDEDHTDRQSDSSADSIPEFLGNHHRIKRIPVGPQFQADVPEWTGKTRESDSKWLGRRIWPLERAEQSRHLIERERIGKGRQDSCGCEIPGSIDCVRFHVSEKRMRLRLELGPAFYRWKFDNMGEEVACSWTQEEEEKFHYVMKSNFLSLGKCFWDEIVKSFPQRSRESLVSYYFNVFLFCRRAHQNRDTPCDINSDDESEFGSETVKPLGSILCSPKKPHLKVD